MELLKTIALGTTILFIITQAFYWGAVYGNNLSTVVKHSFYVGNKPDTVLEFDKRTEQIKIKKLR